LEFSFDTENKKAEALSYELSGTGLYMDFRNGNLSEDKTEVEEMALETMFVNIQSYDYKLVNTSIEQESVISEKENCR